MKKSGNDASDEQHLLPPALRQRHKCLGSASSGRLLLSRGL